MKILGKIFYPLTLVVVFVSLLLSFLLFDPNLIPEGQVIPVCFGLLAFSFAITVILISFRPKFIEKQVGIPMLYTMHGAMATVLIITGVIHAVTELISDKTGFTYEFVAVPMGYVALVFFLFATMTGALVLSNMITKLIKSKKKRKAPNRVAGLIVHRISLLALILIFIHMMMFDFVKANTPLIILSGAYTAIAVIGYITIQIRNRVASKYRLEKIETPNPTVFRLTFAPNKKLMNYEAGQYIFLRFMKSALPKEAHPFSISSSALTHDNTLEVTIKKSGDFTARLAELKFGDIATIEGPYGSFYSDELRKSSAPFVMLAGGIGITPIISIIRDELARNSNREITLYWGLSTTKDLLLEDELKSLHQTHPNFTYHIVLSNEESENYDKGFVSEAYIASKKGDARYKDGEFFICGPGPMMNSMKEILAKNNVDKDRINIEEFSF